MADSPESPWNDPEFRPQLEFDAICRSFERALRGRSKPTIEACLDSVSGPLRTQLVLELIAIECEWRRSAGEIPFVSDYDQRFPELSETLPDLVNSSGLDTAQPKPPPELEIATLELGEFQILREIGRGGMGVVYEATQKSLGRRVALKIVRHLGHLRPDCRDRFLREAKIMATLQHPHIVQAYAAGQQNDVLYLAMALVSGRTLAEIFKGASAFESTVPREIATNKLERITASISRREADRFQMLAQIGAEIADALNHAHQHGVIHRDVKPSNVLLDSAGCSYLTDFGLAKLLSDEDNLTQSDDLLGTLRYAAPELMSGQYDARSDIYSWGLSLYELATLEPAFNKGNPAELIKVLLTTGSPLRQLGVTVLPPAFQSILWQATESQSTKRYATAREFAEDLRRFAKGQTPFAQRRYRSSRQRLIAASLISLTMVLAVAIGLIVRQLSPRSPLDPASAAAFDARIPGPPLQSLQATTLPHPVATVTQKIVHCPGMLIRSVDLSADGKLLATGGDDGAVRIWNMNTGNSIRTIREGLGRTHYVHFCSHDQLLMTASGADPQSSALKLTVWDIDSQTFFEPRFDQGFGDRIPLVLSNLHFFQLVPASNGQLVVVSQRSNAIAWNIRLGAQAAVDLDISPKRIQCVTSRMKRGTPSAIVLGDDTGCVHIRGLSGPKMSSTFNSHLGKLHDLIYTRDEQTLICSGEQGVSLSQAPHTTHTVLPFTEPHPAVQHVVVSQDDKLALVATSTYCRLINLKTFAWEGDGFSLSEPLQWVAWRQATRTLVSVSITGRIRLIDAYTGADLAAPITHSPIPLDTCWCANESLLAVIDDSGTATVYRITPK